MISRVKQVASENNSDATPLELAALHHSLPMKILFLTHRVPFPPNRGDRIRSYHILKFLAARAEVDLACVSDEAVPESSHRELATHCRRVAIAPLSRSGRWARALTSVARGRSATEGLFESTNLRQTLERWTADTSYDAVLVYCSSMGQYLDVSGLQHTPCVVDFIDVDSEKWFDYAGRASGLKRWFYQLEGRRVQKLEHQLAKRAKAITVVSKAEAESFRRTCPNSIVHVVPNGVDLAHFEPQADSPSHARDISAADQLECVFVGALDYFPNIDGVIWFAREVWPEVHARFPKSKFTIVGRRPVVQLRRLTRTRGIQLSSDVTDVRPFLDRARVVVVPLRVARGVQNKVLEALAAGKPTIASPKALSGFSIIPGEQVLEASTPAQWISSLHLLFESESQCSQLAVAGREFVLAHHRWESCLQPLAVLIGMALEVSQVPRCPAFN
jgi:polysaccharide biosynthesis protein PslH